MAKKPTAPTTTVKINHQHDYSTLTVKLASGDTVRYTSSWSGEKMSVSAKDEWLKSNVGMNATFKAIQGMSALAGEILSARYERIKAVAERATTPYNLVEILRAAETTAEQLREARKHAWDKRCGDHGFTPAMFEGTVRINARGKGLIDAKINGMSERNFGKIECLAADGDKYNLDADATRTAYLQANPGAKLPPKPTHDFSNAQVPAPTMVAA